jgi:hypothetical protein
MTTKEIDQYGANFSSKPQTNQKSLSFELLINASNIDDLDDLMETAIQIQEEDGSNKMAIVMDMSDLSLLELLAVAPSTEKALKKYASRIEPHLKWLHLIGPGCAKHGIMTLLKTIRNNGVVCQISCEVV